MINNAETYRKMLHYLNNRGFDVSPHHTAKIASISSASLGEFDDVDLQHYEVILEATLATANEYMDKTAMAQELIDIKTRLGHPVPADVQALTEMEGNSPLENSPVDDSGAPDEDYGADIRECERCGDTINVSEGDGYSQRGPKGNQTTLCDDCTASVYRR